MPEHGHYLVGAASGFGEPAPLIAPKIEADVAQQGYARMG
jgi:hypothetical protein